MSVMYGTVSELASYLQKDLDTSSATLALQAASQLFSTRANTMFVPTSVTYQALGQGYWQLPLPFRPIISVSAVRIIGFGGTFVVTDYTRVKTVLYRIIGFGVPGVFPPDMVEVDLVHGYATVPDDVKGAVLEAAGIAYQGPDQTVAGEGIDDYTVKFSDIGGMMLSPAAATLADLYRGTFAA